MRARKPCVRARRTLDGWYVRFIFAFDFADALYVARLFASPKKPYIRARYALGCQCSSAGDFPADRCKQSLTGNHAISAPGNGSARDHEKRCG